MSEHNTIKTPTSYVRVIIQVPNELPDSFFQFTPSIIYLQDDKGRVIHSEAIPIGSKRIIPRPPGKIAVSAKLGGVFSEEKQIELEAGQVVDVSFYFGK